MSIMYYLVLGSMLFVYVDATKHNIGKIPGKKEFSNMSAGMWATGTALLWIVVFPLYLFKRNRLIEIADKTPQVVPSFRRYSIISIIVVCYMLMLWGEFA